MYILAKKKNLLFFVFEFSFLFYFDFDFYLFFGSFERTKKKKNVRQI